MYADTKSEHMAADIEASSTSTERFLCISSREKTTPARGALNAAARPAPLPAVIRRRSSVLSLPVRREKPLPAIAPI